MFLWNSDKIRFMRDASEYTDFYKKLAECIAVYIDPLSSICDAGCGLGYLSLELSRYVKSIYAVDIDANATGVLAENVKNRGLSNINVYCEDFMRFVAVNDFDAIVFCFFEKMEKVFSIMQACHTNRAIVVKSNTDFRRFAAKQIYKGTETFEEARNFLNDRNIPYKCSIITTDYGQPFKTLEDVYRFYQYYNNDQDVEDTLKRIVTDPKGKFPYYLPSVKDVGIIAFDAL